MSSPVRGTRFWMITTVRHSSLGYAWAWPCPQNFRPFAGNLPKPEWPPEISPKMRSRSRA